MALMNEYKDRFRRHPRRTFLSVGFQIALLFILLAVGISIVGYAVGWFGEAARLTRQEFGPQAMLVKYSWFKDASAQLDKKLADLQVYESRLVNLEASYGDITRRQWAREDREQYNVWQSEIAGVRASFNTLAASYNAEMAKFHYRFANVGELPQGAIEPLPREYKPYQQ